MSRDLGRPTRPPLCCCTNCVKPLAAELKGRMIGGEGKSLRSIPAISVATLKPANLADKRKDRRFAVNQSGKRKAVIIIRERDGKVTPGRVPLGRPSPEFHQVADCQGDRCQRRRIGRTGMNCIAVSK